MATIVVRDGEPIESALRRFKKACERDGIIQELKKREYYKKPSELRNEKKKEKKRRLAKMKRDKTEDFDQKFDKFSEQE